MHWTVFEDHHDAAEATHTVTCRNSRCPRRGVAVLAPPLPGHVSGKKGLREQVSCGHCGAAVWQAEIRPVSGG